LAATRELPRHRLGRRVLFKREEVLEFIVRHRHRYGERLRAYDEMMRPAA